MKCMHYESVLLGLKPIFILILAVYLKHFMVSSSEVNSILIKIFYVLKVLLIHALTGLAMPCIAGRS